MIRFAIFAALVAALYFLVKRAMTPVQQMTVTQAAQLLDVAPDAEHAIIVEAHKRLIAKVHPDAGGTTQLAAQINQARDILLRNISNR